MARKAVEQELSRERILDAAETLFVTHGYHHVSMRQIAKELNYSHGSIYYHFKNKAELFYSLVSRDFSKLDAELEEVLRMEADPLVKLEQVLLGFIRFGLTHRSHYEIMFLIKDEELNTYANEKPNHSYEKFAQAIHELSGRRVTPAIVWSLFLSLHGFVSHYCKTGQTWEDVRPLAETHVKLLMKAIL